MEAFTIAPAPPQAMQSSKSLPAEHNHSETSFAPALSQAIQNKNNSSPGKQESSTGKPSAADLQEAGQKTDTLPSEDFSGDGEEQAFVASGQPAQDTARLFSSGQPTQDTARLFIASSYSQANRMPLFLSGAMNNPTNNGNNQPGQLPATLQLLKNLTTTPTGFSAEEVRTMDTAGARSTPLSSSAQAAPQIPSGAFAVQSSEKILEMLGKNDSIAFTQGKTPVSHAILHNHGLLPTQFEEGILTPKNTLSPEKIIAHLTDLSIENGNTPLRDKPLTLRQDLSSQFFNAKIQQDNGNSEQKSGQQSLQSEQESGKQNSLTQSLKTNSSPVETSFSQSLNTVTTDKNTQPQIEQMRPSPPSSNVAVSENEILQQVAQKFRISQHLQNSRIVMKLHPAELGDMKVDIHLKDGTINASIQVQTRQVLEVLEKNMPRLKELMEQQGLRIDGIVLNIDKDMPADYNLFEDQLAQNENPFFNSKKSASHIPFDLNNEDPTALHEEDNSSQAAVNVTI